MKKIATYKKAIGIAILSIILFCTWLYLSSLSFSLTDNKALEILYKIEAKLGTTQQPSTQDVLFVDISYDKAFAPVYDEYGMPKGHMDITDRAKLARFLQIANQYNEYKYMLIDVFFDSQYNTPFDSLLFTTIAQTPRLVIPKHADALSIDSLILPKAAYADYVAYKSPEFSKYALFESGEPTIATSIYMHYYDKEIVPYGWMAKEDGKLIFTNVMPTQLYAELPTYDDHGNKVLYYLGSDVLALAEIDEQLVAQLLKDKFIIVGSFFEDDIHTTFKGDLPGPLIIYNVFLSLSHQQHYISILFIIFLMFVFVVLTWKCITQPDMMHITKYKWINLVLSWGSYSIIMIIINIIGYITCGRLFDILIVATIFQTLEIIINYYSKYETRTFTLLHSAILHLKHTGHRLQTAICKLFKH